MTGSGSGAPGRDMTAGPASRRGIGRQLLIVLAIGLVLRLIIAYLLPNSGFSQDLGAFRFWASNLATQGPWGFYQRDFFHDYTPGYLYVLWLVGIVGQFLGGVGDLIKVPPVLADLALGYLVYSMADELGVPRRLATAGAAIVVLNPITWFDSVVWGQADSFGVVFLLLAIRELWRGRHERAAILAVVAALIKPQLGILVPVVAFVTIRRALWPEAEPPPPSGTAWERETAGLVRVLTTALAGLLTAIVLSAPFGLSLPGLVGQIFSTAAGYPYVTVNAYNAWALLPLDGQSLATNGGWILDAPRAAGEAYAAVAGVPALVIGSVALLASLLVVPLLIARRPEPLTILVGVSVLALAFFGLPTRVHERYLFPLFALTAVLATFSWRWRIAYAVASVATFLNMYVVLTTIYDNSGQGIHDWLGIGNAVRSFWGVALIAVAHTAVLAWGFAQLRAGAARSLAAELEGSGSDDRRPDEEREPGVSAEARPATGATLPGPAAPAATAASAVAAALPPARPATAVTGPAVASAARRVPAWYDRPWMAELGPIGWIRARMSETPIRPDRSRQLEREGGGRLDRLDLWIVVVIVVAALGLRMFRLAEPARMHFDEVYHARTATEFLQDWRYGIPHTIYEWTHPHLAKYAMALGIVLFAGHDVQASSDLGVTIRDAAIEPRRAGAESATAREGDRAWVVTGSELIGYDLETRAVAARFPLPGASAVAFDTNALDLLVGTDSGEVWALDATMLDLLRGSNPADPPVDPQLVGTLDGPIRRIAGFDGGQRIAALLPDDAVAVMDLGTGSETGRVAVAGAADLLDAGSGDAVVASPVDVVDPAAVASRLASILGGDAAAYQADLAQADADTVVIDAELTADVRSAIQDAIDAGTLPGIRIEPTPVLAVAGSGGVTFVSGRGTITARVPLTGGASGLALVSGVDEGTQLWATTRDDASGDPEVAVIAVSGDQAKSGPNRTDTVPLPGAGSKLVFDDAAQMVEVLGVAPDDSAPTVYVIETHGKAVYADHRLPFTPVAWALDHDGAYPTSSRGQILAFGGHGETAAIDIGHYPFAWRLPGVVLGALTAGIIYLLTRVLFRRREVAVLAGLFVLLDGMFFVQSRIAMNDVYTAAFILAAYLLFAKLWLEPRRRWSFWLLMPVIGGLLGLALASKWVAAYAIGALGILVLLRSALGRLILIAGMIGMTGVLGWLALAVPPDSGGMGNLTFAIIMVALTLSTVALAVYRPIAWSDEEMWLAVAGPGALGIIVVLGAIGLGRAGAAVTLGPLSVTPIAAGFALVVAGLAMYAAFQVAGRLGFGPMAASTAARPPSGVPPAAPPAEGWLRLGSGLGLPIVWMLGSLIVIPVVVYVISYIPWTFIDSHRLWPGMPPGNTGQTLLDLTGEMYRYHNNLTAAHPASSPWWAWPLNLKPVWFYQGSFANSTAGSIYDAGNMVIWWLGIPATVFVAWQAYRRRSLPLALIVIGLLAQWISWARIDRAAFEYHYYTSLPFVVMALAYFVAELWHGASRRTWLLARISAGVALMGPVLLWLVRLPMCQLANVQAVNQGSQACVVSTAGSLVITPSTAATAVVGVVTLLVLVRLLMRLGQPSDIGRPVGAGDLVPLVVTALAGGALLAVSRVLPSTDPLVSLPGIVPELIAFVVGLPLLLVVAQVVTARDARRFVIGIVAAAAIWFVVLYPNVSALPLPSTLVNAYQGLLPTYLYAFQFAVNTVDRSGLISFSDPRFAILMVFLVISSVVVAYAAWVWRASLATDVAEEPADSAPTGPAGEAGAA